MCNWLFPCTFLDIPISPIYTKVLLCKSAYLNLTSRGDQYILTFDVPMHYILTVQVIKPFSHAFTNSKYIVFWNVRLFAFVFCDQIHQVTLSCILHHNAEVPSLFPLFASLFFEKVMMNLYYIFVFDLFKYLGLSHHL